MPWSSLTEKIFVRVLDPFTIKPLDRKLILDSARATKGRILTVEDHYYEGNWGCASLDSTTRLENMAGVRKPKVDMTLKSSEDSLPLPRTACQGLVQLSQPAAVSCLIPKPKSGTS